MHFWAHRTDLEYARPPREPSEPYTLGLCRPKRGVGLDFVREPGYGRPRWLD
jgi:hypothetical protein